MSVANLWAASKKHPVVAVVVSIALTVAAIVGFLSGLAAIWTVMSRDTVPEFLEKQGWLSGWAMSAPPLFPLVVMVASVGVLLLLVALWNEAIRQRTPSVARISTSWWWRWRASLPTDDDMLRKRLVDRTQEYEVLTADFRRVSDERDAARQAFERCRHNFTMERFDRFAEGVKSSWPDLKVTIRTVQYNDWKLVEEIKGLIEPRWPVTIDPSNLPPLMPDEPFKVVLTTGDSDRMMRLRALLDSDDGRLLGVRVGLRKRPDHDNKHLVIEILPTVQS